MKKVMKRTLAAMVAGAILSGVLFQLIVRG